jgi:NADH:ubiquinone oxidoreductase subunit 5 (subunit L)/multisubunit Na+/H+ antiporter MnhA subunit
MPVGFQLWPDSWEERFGHFVEPVAGYFPAISHGTPSWSLAIVSSLIAFAGIGFAYWYYFVKVDALAKKTNESLTELPNGLVATNPVARLGHTVLVRKYYLDWLYTDVIVAFVKGPLARATNWFNQNVLDAFVDSVGENSVKAGRKVYDVVDQGVIDGVVNGMGTTSDASGQGLRQIQTGKVQQYAALLFAGAAILAGVFVILISL